MNGINEGNAPRFWRCLSCLDFWRTERLTCASCGSEDFGQDLTLRSGEVIARSVMLDTFFGVVEIDESIRVLVTMPSLLPARTRVALTEISGQLHAATLVNDES